MAWPPSSNIAGTGIGIVSVQPTTVAWGTTGMLTSAIVKSIRVFNMIFEADIENGDGLTSALVLLKDGVEVEVTCVDDRAIVTWPDTGQVFTINSPLPNGAGLTTLTFQAINNSYQAARKVEGERTFSGKRFTLITPTAM